MMSLSARYKRMMLSWTERNTKDTRVHVHVHVHVACACIFVRGCMHAACGENQKKSMFS